jgi:hypothetical protein
MSGKVNPVKGNPLAKLRGVDVQVSVQGGAVVRGSLVAAGPEWLQVERRTGRLAFVRSSAVTSVTDERPPGLVSAGRRSTEETLDREEGE